MVSQKEVIGIFDLDKTTVSKATKIFLQKAEKERKIETIGQEIPKSFIIIKHNGKIKVYLSPISSATLYKRSHELIRGKVKE